MNVDTDTADRSRVNIFINYRVFDYQGNYIGATGVGLSVQAVTRLIDTYQERYNRSIYFVDRQGNVTLTGQGYQHASRLQERSALGPLATRILSTPSTSFSYTSNEGATTYVNSRLVPEFDWYLIVEQEGTAAERRLDTTLLLNIGLSVVIMAVVLLAAHLTLRGYQRRLEEMATRDRLTGTANRHLFEMLFEQVHQSARRQGRPVSLVSIDLDHFKPINDSYGHQAGDHVLRSVASIIQESIRKTDTLSRWGGEEFVLLLDDCALADAEAHAARIREAVKAHTMVFGRNTVNVTVSIGITQCRDNDSLEACLARADAALYRAKENGRDRVETAL